MIKKMKVKAKLAIHMLMSHAYPVNPILKRGGIKYQMLVWGLMMMSLHHTRRLINLTRSFRTQEFDPEEPIGVQWGFLIAKDKQMQTRGDRLIDIKKAMGPRIKATEQEDVVVSLLGINDDMFV